MPVKKVTVELFRDEIDNVLQDDVGKDVVDTTIRVMNRAKVMCPVRTGTLRAAHNFKIRRALAKITGEVFNKVRYALPVHDGSKQHVVYPTKKKALAFVWHGQPMVRRWVNIPAQPGRPWMRDALREVAAQRGYKMVSTVAADQPSSDSSL